MHDNQYNQQCGPSWHGFKSTKIWSIKTTLNGCGIARLDFGNCYQHGGQTKVYLNGNEIGIANANELSKKIEFNFNDGDTLMLKGHELGTIRFNDFSVIGCCFTYIE